MEAIDISKLYDQICSYNEYVVEGYDNSPEGNREIIDNLYTHCGIKNHFTSLFGEDTYNVIVDNMLLTDIILLGKITPKEYNTILLYSFDKKGFSKMMNIKSSEAKDLMEPLIKKLFNAFLTVYLSTYCDRKYALNNGHEELFFRLNMIYKDNISPEEYVKMCSYNKECVIKVFGYIAGIISQYEEDDNEKDKSECQSHIVNMIQYLTDIGFEMNELYDRYRNTISDSISDVSIRLGKFILDN